MTTDKKVARRKLSLLELATDLQNVSKACRLVGYSRQQFYEIRRNFQLRCSAHSQPCYNFSGLADSFMVYPLYDECDVIYAVVNGYHFDDVYL